MRKSAIVGLAGLAAAALIGISGFAPPQDPAHQADAKIEARSGSTVEGRAVFTELASGGVRVEVWIDHATPGAHGLHLHENGDCSAPDATSAGGHFNPSGSPHAGPAEHARHAGDLGNIEIGADGKGYLEIRSDLLTVKPGPNSVVGRAVVFHEKPDDLKTQPTGAAGARQGCGVIQ